MKIPVITEQKPLQADAGVSKLYKVEFARNPHPALLKEPKQYWDEVFIANEAGMLDEITHPRIRKKLAYESGSHRLFLEYLEAVPLNELVRTGATLKDPGRTHKILQSVAETVADLHAGIFCDRPIVHNDLKNANVLVPDARPEEGILIDFSHAYFAGEVPPFIFDKKQNPAGTARFTSPEKWEGDFSNGFKHDVFAFGVMGYYTCTGKYPFDGRPAQIEKQIREVTPPSPIQLGLNVPRNISVTLMACLEKKPEKRPTMEQVARSYAIAASLYR